MTTYEKWALALSIIAILIPFVQWIWKNWMQRPILQYYPTGKAYLHFNTSGSYIRIDGVFEAFNKPIAVKKVTVKIHRESDDKNLNLVWSTLLSPVNQSIAGAYTSTQETAHPFRIDADSIMCAFIEFAPMANSSWRAITPSYDQFTQLCKTIKKDEMTFDDAIKTVKLSAEYSSVKSALEKEFYWRIGNYKVEIQTYYGKKNTKSFTYGFSVDEYNLAKLRNNIGELLLAPLKPMYNIPLSMQVAEIELK